MDIEAFLTRIDLSDLAERAGAQFSRNGNSREIRSACPLHGGDNKAAFAVRRNGGADHWRCYTACDSGGDAIDFIRRWRGLEFGEAVQELARLYHLNLADYGYNKPVDLQAEQQRRARADLFGLAADIFQGRLWSAEGAAARAYLAGRAISAETIQALRLGWTPGDDLLGLCLGQWGGDLAAAREAGLIRADGLDFTANADGRQAGPHGWIIFPHATGERITYFSSRAVDLPEQPRPNPADKSRNLPGARQVYRCQAAGDWDTVTLVEGPMDAASLYQLGRTAYALCGLGSLDQAEIDRLQKRSIYIGTDSDQAGQAAISQAERKLAQTITAIGPLAALLPTLEAGKDFNAALQNGLDRAALDQLYSRSKSWIEVRMEQAGACPDSELETRMIEIGALLARVPEAVIGKFYKLASQHLGMSRADVIKLVKQAVQKDSGNILASVNDGQLCFANRPLLNGVIKITNELIMDDGQDMPFVRFTVSGRLVNGQPLESLDVPADEFSDFKWIPRHWGRGPILYISRGQMYELDRAIKEISQEAQRERCYTYTGWTKIDGRRCYLTASGAISEAGLDPKIRVDLGHNNLRHYALPEPPSGGALYDAVQASLEFLQVGPRHVTAPIWAAMYASVLNEIAPLYAVLWVYGQTQSGKSTIMHLALAHFGRGFINGRQYHAPIDWTSTQTALEGAMFTAKDTPLVIDDFAPQFASAADSRGMHGKAHYVIRSVGNRSSRGRARADLSARKERTPRGLVIATAENPLMGQSIVGRMIYIPVGRGEITPLDGRQNPALDLAQDVAQRGMYAQAMAAFVQWLAVNWERVSAGLPERLNKAAAYARERSAQIQGRLPDYFALLSVASNLALEAFCEMGLITEHEAQREKAANVQAILGVVAQQAERIATESPIRKVFEALGSLLGRKKIYLAPRTGQANTLPPDRAELVGWHGNKMDELDQVYLDTRQALIAARQYWADLGENLDILPDAFLLQCRQIPGLISRTGEAGRDEASIFAQGKTRRLLALDRKRILELYGVDISNESNIGQDS